jgi:hypothetical protein
MLVTLASLALAHAAHRHIPYGCVLDRVSPPAIGLVVPGTSGDALWTAGSAVYFAGHGHDVPAGSDLRATQATIDGAHRFGVVPYALVEYHTDCGTGGYGFGVTMTRWRRIDGTKPIPLDVPAAVADLHARVLAAAAADPAWTALLDAQRSQLPAPGIIAPDALSESLAWQDDRLVARFQVVRAETVFGACPGMGGDCDLPSVVSSVGATFTATVDADGTVAIASGPVSGAVAWMPPMP